MCPPGHGQELITLVHYLRLRKVYLNLGLLDDRTSQVVIIDALGGAGGHG
jgi:hypothetical protein